MAVIILAGGESSRIGRDKTLLPFGTEHTLLEYIILRLEKLEQKRIVVTRKQRNNYRSSPVLESKIEWVFDLYEAGPLGGIHAGLKATSDPYSFIMGADMPFICPELLEYMLEKVSRDILIPRHANGHLEPLHAVYHRGCIPVIEESIAAENYKLSDFLDKVDIEYLSPHEIEKFDPQKRSLYNINTWQDYQKALKLDGEQDDSHNQHSRKK